MLCGGHSLRMVVVEGDQEHVAIMNKTITASNWRLCRCTSLGAGRPTQGQR